MTQNTYRYTTPIDMKRATHYGNNYWIFFSEKLGRTVKAFSNLEFYNLITLEMNSNVEYYCEQPCRFAETITTDIGSLKNKECIPDVYVYYRDGLEEIQEVKYSSEIKSDSKNGLRDREQIKAEEQWCARTGLHFKLRTERVIIDGKFFIQNLMILSRRVLQAHGHVNFRIRCKVMTVLTKNPHATVQTLIDAGCFSDGDPMTVLAVMYYDGRIDLLMKNHPLDLDVEVKLNA